MQLKDIMTTDVVTVTPTATLEEAARLMRDVDTGVLPVCDGDRLVGMVTDRDMAVRATAEGDRADTAVASAMSAEVTYCYEDADVDEAATIMAEQQIRRLPVLDHDKRLVGIVSLGDVATQTGDARLGGATLEEVSEDSS